MVITVTAEALFGDKATMSQSKAGEQAIKKTDETLTYKKCGFLRSFGSLSAKSMLLGIM